MCISMAMVCKKNKYWTRIKKLQKQGFFSFHSNYSNYLLIHISSPLFKTYSILFFELNTSSSSFIVIADSPLLQVNIYPERAVYINIKTVSQSTSKGFSRKKFKNVKFKTFSYYKHVLKMYVFQNSAKVLYGNDWYYLVQKLNTPEVLYIMDNYEDKIFYANLLTNAKGLESKTLNHSSEYIAQVILVNTDIEAEK